MKVYPTKTHLLEILEKRNFQQVLVNNQFSCMRVKPHLVQTNVLYYSNSLPLLIYPDYNIQHIHHWNEQIARLVSMLSIFSTFLLPQKMHQIKNLPLKVFFLRPNHKYFFQCTLSLHMVFHNLP